MHINITKKNVSRIGIVLVIVLVIVLFKLFNIGQYLSLSYIKESRSYFREMYENNSVVVTAIYMAIYIIVTVLSLPGATVLTLAAGALFGLVTGVVVVSFASSVGATLACFVARFIFRDWVEKKFHDKLIAISKGMEKEGAFYLFTLRLIPLFPFFVINLVMGLTKMRLWTFYWVSQLGMLGGTIVYVYAGREIGRIDSVSSIISPRILFAFALLGLFPLSAKKIMNYIKIKRETVK